ncbi:MAG: hypothetical protein KAR84_07100 [Elusimicrobiales bacterium]|nr:hypothetical protein [Elusimicrobiales bacterium]MCK5107019.1 hypothetical protein [Elusimicrobiales bacterium]
MRSVIFLVMVFIFGGCAFNKSNLKNAAIKGNEAVVAKSENYILSDPTDYNKIADFNEKILEAYKRTISNANSADVKTGFVYKIIPKGIVNPFSEVRVECMVQNKYSGKYGVKLCNKFFKNIEEEFK